MPGHHSWHDYPRLTLTGLKVPQIGWNGFSKGSSIADELQSDDTVYFVHSFCALLMKRI